MNTTQLECFMEVANFLNFSRAAEHLRITQPAVSHQITALEDELGVKLFQRTSKNVRLTQEGYLFTQYAGEILKLSRLSKARMKESSQTAAQHLVIGCRNPTELRFLTPALERLRAEQPEALPVLRLIPFDSLENLLEEGEIHMMFSYREAAPAKSRFRELIRVPAVCACGREHPLAGATVLTMEQLRQGGRIAACRPRGVSPALLAIQNQAIGVRETQEILFCDNQEVMLPLLEAGYAFAVVADIPHARLPALRYIPLPECEPLSFGAAYMPEGNSPLLRQFLTLLRESPPGSEIEDSSVRPAQASPAGALRWSDVRFRETETMIVSAPAAPGR